MSRIRITRHIGMIRRLSCSIQTVYRGIPVVSVNGSVDITVRGQNIFSDQITPSPT